MNADATLWIGIAAGAVIGTAATWITIGVAIALGRYLAYRGALIEPPVEHEPVEPPADTFDLDLRALIKTQERKP